MQDGQKVTLKVRLQEPGTGSSRLASYDVPYGKDMRVIDALNWLNAEGESIAYRWFCSSKKCGACAMKVNGVPRLTCWEKLEAESLIEPLDNFEVIRDLVVDREPYQARYLSLKPYISRTHTPSFPEPLKHTDILGTYKLMDCIECGICTSGCPAYSGVDGPFPGPWALVQAAKFARDPRDELDRSLQLENSGVDLCMSCHRCDELCPVQIPIVREAIEPLRGIAARGPTGKASFPLAFAENIRGNAYVHSTSLFLKTRGVFGVIGSLGMIARMFTHGKTKLFGRGSETARRAIRALFAAAGERGIT